MGSPKITLNKPLLILMYGFPGAGKTYFARNLSEYLNCAHINADKIRHELFEEPRFNKSENNIITHLMDYMAGEFLNLGSTVIYDTNMIRKSQRRIMKALAQKRATKTLLVWFQLDPETAYNRLTKRDKRKTDDKYAKEYSQEDFREYTARMQHPDQTEDFVVVSGKHSFASQKTAIFNKFLDLGLMEAEIYQNNVAKPGLINLVPKTLNGRVDMSRRNIDIR